MKICPVDEIVNESFNVVFINALKQFWHTTKQFSCIGEPKKQNLFLFLSGCKITYTDKNNKVITANSGDVVYTPIGSEYKAQLSDFDSENSHTIGINFFLFDKLGEGILLSDEIKVFRGAQAKTLSLLFNQTLYHDTVHSLTRNRILLMEIICALTNRTSKNAVPDYITNSICYLSENVEENPTIAELAKLCNISEVYFRKQFKKHTGMSPLEYRNCLRLGKARSYLEYGEISVQEISDALGYAAVSHFIKEFKKQYGCSPLKYRKEARKTSVFC